MLSNEVFQALKKRDLLTSSDDKLEEIDEKIIPGRVCFSTRNGSEIDMHWFRIGKRGLVFEDVFTTNNNKGGHKSAKYRKASEALLNELAAPYLNEEEIRYKITAEEARILFAIEDDSFTELNIEKHFTPRQDPGKDSPEFFSVSFDYFDSTTKGFVNYWFDLDHKSGDYIFDYAFRSVNDEEDKKAGSEALIAVREAVDAYKAREIEEEEKEENPLSEIFEEINNGTYRVFKLDEPEDGQEGAKAVSATLRSSETYPTNNFLREEKISVMWCDTWAGFFCEYKALKQIPVEDALLLKDAILERSFPLPIPRVIK